MLRCVEGGCRLFNPRSLFGTVGKNDLEVTLRNFRSGIRFFRLGLIIRRLIAANQSQDNHQPDSTAYHCDQKIVRKRTPSPQKSHAGRSDELIVGWKAPKRTLRVRSKSLS